MTGESRETEPFQKALMMETGTVIFLKCLSERFSEKKISRVRKPGAPDTALKSYDFPRFLRQRGNEIGWNTEFTVPLHRGGFLFSRFYGKKAAMSRILTAEHIKKSFGKNTILKDINLTVEKGDVISILGPSGTGKTTLLRCFNYLENPRPAGLLLTTCPWTFPIFPKRKCKNSGGNPPWSSSSSICSATRMSLKTSRKG